MASDASIRFFEAQFRRQVGRGDQGDHELNPFESRVLPYLHGEVLEFGCGLGKLALAAARRGSTVLALDASRTAIEHLRHVAQTEALPLRAFEADLRTYALDDYFDAVVSIGLLMFFDCPTAQRVLAQLQAHVRPGGVAIVNVLVEGTTYLEMFDLSAHCLFGTDELRARFAGWQIERCEAAEFAAPNDTQKRFCTIVARKPRS